MDRLAKQVSSGSKTGPDEWKCGSCDRYNDARATTCVQCGNVSPDTYDKNREESIPAKIVDRLLS